MTRNWKWHQHGSNHAHQNTVVLARELISEKIKCQRWELKQVQGALQNDAVLSASPRVFRRRRGTVPSGGNHRLPREDGGSTICFINFFYRARQKIHRWNCLDAYIPNLTSFSANTPWTKRIEGKLFWHSNFNLS